MLPASEDGVERSEGEKSLRDLAVKIDCLLNSTGYKSA